MAFDAKTILRRQSMLANERANFDSHWDEIAELVLPNAARFTERLTPGDKRMERVFDSTAIAANQHFAAGMQSMLTPATERWHRLTTVDPRLEDDYDVRVWTDEATDALFHLRYAPRAQFGQAVAEAMLAFGAFGNAVVMVDENVGRHFVYRAGHPREYYFVEDQYGVVDTIYRKFCLTAEQAKSEFGEVLPDDVLRAAEKAPDTWFEFVRVVTPKGLVDYGDKLPPWFEYASCTVSCTGEKVIRERGYRSFPYAIARYSTTSGEVYGRGPGVMTLPDIKMVNEMMKTIIRAAQLVVDPPWLAVGDDVMQGLVTRPGAINWGGVDRQGRKMVEAMHSNARLDIGLELLQDVRNRIERGFNVDLWRVLVDKPGTITATEALIRAQEKGALLAPVGLRAQGEFLGRLIARELDMAEVAMQLPPMPRALLEAGGPAAIKVEFEAPVNQFQKAQKGVAINSFLASIQAYAAVEPAILDGVDFDEIRSEMLDVSGAPQMIERSPEAIEAIRAKKQEQAEMAQALGAAEQAGAAAKDLAAAQAQGAGQPPNLLSLFG